MVSDHSIPVADALKLLLAKTSAAEERELLVRFFVQERKVDHRTVERWLTGKQLPNGQALLTLAVYLTIRGFRVVEFEQIPERYRTVAQAVALGAINHYDLAASLSFNDVSDIWRAFRGRSMGKGREAIVQELANRHSADVAMLLAKYAGAPVDLKAIRQFDGSLRASVVESLAGMMASILPLVRLVNGDSFGESDRQRLRELAGGSTVFDLSNELSDLCSQRSREIGKRGGTNGR